MRKILMEQDENKDTDIEVQQTVHDLQERVKSYLEKKLKRYESEEANQFLKYKKEVHYRQIVRMDQFISIEDLVKRWHGLKKYTHNLISDYRVPLFELEVGNNNKAFLLDVYAYYNVAHIDGNGNIIDACFYDEIYKYGYKYLLIKDIEELEKKYPELCNNEPSNIVTLQQKELDSIKQQITELENENAQLKNQIQELEEIPLDKRVKALVRNILSIVYDFVTKDNIAELQKDYRKVLEKGYNKIKGDSSKFNNLTYATLRGYLDRYKKLKEDKDKQDQKTK